MLAQLPRGGFVNHKAIDAEFCDPARYSIVTDGSVYRVRSPAGLRDTEYKSKRAAQEEIDFALRFHKQRYAEKYEGGADRFKPAP